MEERQIKRLLIIVAVSIAIIMLFKMMLTDSITTLNKTAAEKKPAVANRPSPEPSMLLPQAPPATSIEAPDTTMIEAQNVPMIEQPVPTEEGAASVVQIPAAP